MTNSLKITNIFRLALSTLLIANLYADNPGISDYYNPSNLFNIDAVKKLPCYKIWLTTQNAVSIPDAQALADQAKNEATLKRALQNQYLKNRQRLYNQAIKSTALQGSIMPGAAILMLVLMKQLAGSNQLLNGIMVTNIFFNALHSANHVWRLLFDYKNPKNDSLFALEKQYMINKLDLNNLDCAQDQNNQSIPYPEKVFQLFRTSPNEKLFATRYLNIYLKQPQKSKAVHTDWQMLKKLEKLYSKDNCQIIYQACANHAASYSPKLGLNKQNKEFLNFIAKPGTGKTYTANLIAQALSLPIATINLANQNSAQIFGDDANPGTFLEALINLGWRNGIILLDELDRALQDHGLMASLLAFLEPGTKTFYSPYLKRTIDVSHLFFISCGNLNFTEESLQNRFHPLRTVQLGIERQKDGLNGELIQTTMQKYLPSRLQPQEIIQPETVKAWQGELEKYLREQSYLNFRDAFAKIDNLLGSWRVINTNPVPYTQ